jgi:Phage tail tube protein
MANYAITRQEHVYMQPEATFGQIPNTAGTATLAGSNACRHINAGLVAVVNNYPRPDKTGTRSQVVGLLGRKSATWSLSASLAGNGAAGVAPDCGAILTALFGIAPTVVAATSVTYNLSDPSPIPSLSLYSFRTPSTLAQRVIAGAVVGEATFQLGQNIATWSASGSGIWCLDSDNFSTSDVTQKSGLTAYPAEPATPVTNGNSTVGFTGLATFDGNVIAEIQTASIRLRTGSVVALDTFGSYYPVLAEGEARTVGLSFTIYDSDGTGIKDLKAKAITQTPITITLQIGTIAGNIWTFNLANVQVAAPTYDDSKNRYMCVFPESMAHATTILVRDEIVLALT